MADIDAFRRQLPADEAPHGFVADAGQQRRFQPQPRGADGNIGRAAADIFGEGLHVLHQPAHLLAIEIDARPPDANDVEGTLTHSP
jgi:hypothetical protein